MNRFQGRTNATELCRWAGLSRSSYYYKPQPGKRGRKASQYTLKGGKRVDNDQVIDEIREILSQPYCAYGYKNVTGKLREQGYLINPKKTYRLMKEQRLLCGKAIRTQGKREWVKFRKIKAVRPMEYICLDLKYVWVHGENRFYYQLAIIDVFSRKIIYWIFQRSVKHTDVIRVMRLLDLRYGLKGVIIRNDNGSQFIANKVRQALIEMQARQEFTHVATPEENAYIEAFHSIEQRELFDRFEFKSYLDAKQHIEAYIKWYNNERRHGSLNGATPEAKWAQGIACSPLRPTNARAGAGLSRPEDTFEKIEKNHPLATSLDKTGARGYLCQSGEQAAGKITPNLAENTVQEIGG